MEPPVHKVHYFDAPEESPTQGLVVAPRLGRT